MPGAPAQEHVIVMLLGLEQEASVEEPIRVWAVQMKLEPVQVGECIILKIYENSCYLHFQLREHGQRGMPGALVQEPVILMQLGLVQEAPVEATHHAQEAQLKRAVAQVWQCNKMFQIEMRPHIIYCFS